MQITILTSAMIDTTAEGQANAREHRRDASSEHTSGGTMPRPEISRGSENNYRHTCEADRITPTVRHP